MRPHNQNAPKGQNSFCPQMATGTLPIRFGFVLDLASPKRFGIVLARPGSFRKTADGIPRGEREASKFVSFDSVCFFVLMVSMVMMVCGGRSSPLRRWRSSSYGGTSFWRLRSLWARFHRATLSTPAKRPFHRPKPTPTPRQGTRGSVAVFLPVPMTPDVPPPLKHNPPLKN